MCVKCFKEERETRLDHEELKGWGRRIFRIQNYKDDHMVWKATDEHDTSPHMPVSHHKWHVLAYGNILYEHTHFHVFIHAYSQKKNGEEEDSTMPSPAESFYVNHS